MRLPLVGAVACGSVALGIWLVTSGTLAKADLMEFTLKSAACTFYPVEMNGKEIAPARLVNLAKPNENVSMNPDEHQGLVWVMDAHSTNEHYMGPRATIRQAPNSTAWSATAVFSGSGHYAMMTVDAKQMAILTLHSADPATGAPIIWSSQTGACWAVEREDAA